MIGFFIVFLWSAFADCRPAVGRARRFSGSVRVDHQGRRSFHLLDAQVAGQVQRRRDPACHRFAFVLGQLVAVGRGRNAAVFIGKSNRPGPVADLLVGAPFKHRSCPFPYSPAGSV